MIKFDAITESPQKIGNYDWFVEMESMDTYSLYDKHKIKNFYYIDSETVESIFEYPELFFDEDEYPIFENSKEVWLIHDTYQTVKSKMLNDSKFYLKLKLDYHGYSE